MMKIALLTILILGLSYRHVAAFIGTPKECCYAYRIGKPLPYTLFKSYYRTSRDCFLDAVVFLTKKGVKVCLNPELPWVKKAMNKLVEGQQTE